MKIKKNLFKITALSVAFTLGIGVAVYTTAAHKEADATQYNGNYAPYTYSGDYYNDINFDATGGMNGALRTSLTSLIKPQGFYTYGGGGDDHLSGVLQDADEDPTNPNNMVTFYTRDSIKKTAATVGGKVVWNREHVWCQSLSNGNWGEKQGGTDILHLRPTYASPNSTRNNHKYGDNENGTPKRYENMLYGWLEDDYFEPLDCVKGDAARIIMYVWTTYTGWSGYNPLNITNVFRDYDTLLRWHTLDKPDALEGSRNDYAETSKQKNRNPFVDHPELGWKIFGDMASASVKNSCMAAYPVGGVAPVEPTGISLNKSTASVEVNRSTQLRATLEPAGATGTITWSSSSTSIATVSSDGLVTGKAVGSATITATIGSYSASCVVTVSETANNYGTLENPLSVSDALEVLYDAGTSMTSEKIYVKGIVSSNTAYSTQYSDYNKVWLQSEDGEEEQALELYNIKIDSSVTGDYSAANSLKGCEVVAYGYGTKYQSIYELAPKGSDKPIILSVRPVEETVLRLDKTTAEITVGNTTILVPTLTPADPSAEYTWESSDEDIATVNNGVVTGVSAGTAVITVKVSDTIKAECTITVTSNGGGGGQQTPTTLFEADVTSTPTVTVGYSITHGTVTSKTGYYQDGGSAGNVNYFKVTRNTPLFVSEPSKITFTANLGAGSAKDPLDNNVEACLVNGDGDEISSTKVTLTSKITSSNSTEYSVDLPYNANAYGAKISHVKVSGHNIRYYSFSLSYVAGGSPVLPTPRDNISSVGSIVGIGGNESDSGAIQNVTKTITFSTLGLNNGEQYLEPFNGDGFAVTFAGSENDGKYYDTGSGIRTYGGGTITISSAYAITSIAMKWSGANKPSDGSVVNPGTYDTTNDTWTGSSNTVVFTRPTGSGHWRLQSVKATFGAPSKSVSDVYMEFGTAISKTDWDSINANEGWEITDYGVMFVKETTLEDSYNASSVEEAYRNGDFLKIVHKGDGDDPYEDNGIYMFSAALTINKETNYDVVYCAASYIVVNDTYYFLTEERESVRSLAAKSIGQGTSELSDAALTILKGNQGE